MLGSAPIAALLVASQFFHTNTLRFAGFGLARALDGTAARPYAFRVMTGWLVDLALACHAQALRIPFLSDVVAVNCPAIQALTATNCGQVSAYAFVSLLCAWGFLVGTYIAALRVVGGAVWGWVASLLAALAVNALLLQGYGHLYDFPVLLAATWLFILAVQQRDLAFLAAFAWACFVKESLAVFALVYVLIGLRARGIGPALGRLAVQGTVFGVIYGWEQWRFAGNIGLPFYHYGSQHIRFLLDTVRLPELLLLVLALVLLLYGLPRKHPALRRAMLVLPVMVVLYVAGGNPGEFRIAFDVFPIVLLPVVDTLRRISAEA